MNLVPDVLSEDLAAYNDERLRNEGRLLNRAHPLPRTLAEWRVRREEIKAKIWALAGVGHDSSVDLDLKIVKSLKCEGYTVHAVHYQTRPGIRATALLYVPDGEGPFPGVLNLHGHSKEGRRMAYIQARGHSLAKNGYVCLSPDTWGMGERSTVHEEYEYHGAMLGGSLFLLGETLLGALLVDNMRGVDLLASLPVVDAGNLAVTGESGGGNATMWVGAMDERLKAVMPVVSVGSFESYVMRSNCCCEVLPGGLCAFEEDAVLALVAPRYLRMLNALQDSNPTFSVSEMMRSYRRAKEIFALCGAEQNISFAPFDTGHGYKPVMREAMLGFLDYCLKGVGNGNARAELPYGTIPDFDALAVFGRGDRPSGFGTISEYCGARFAALRARGAKTLPAEDEKAEIRRVFGCVREVCCEAVPLGCVGGGETTCVRVEEPPCGVRERYVHRVGALGAEGAEFDRWLLKGPRGLVVPCLVREASGACSATYAMSSATGKRGLEKCARLDELLADKSARIVLFDLFATGENGATELEPGLPAFHTVARALLWLGRSLMGEWTDCYRLVASFARSALKADRLVLFGKGEAGVAAMAATILERGKDAVAFEGEDVPGSFAWAGGETRPAPWRTCAELVAGFSEWGDVARLKRGLAQALGEDGVSPRNGKENGR